MRFLVDECLTPRVAELLTQAGHEAVHLGTVGLLGRPDEEVMEFARQHAQVVVSADTDFGELLALGGSAMPSVILLRRSHGAAGQAGAIRSALPDIEDSLRDGAIVVITQDRVRIRDLPIY